MHERFEDLTLTHWYIFPEVFADIKNINLAKQLIELATQREVEELRCLGKEQNETIGYYSHGVRFDVKFKGGKKHYIVEMQNYKDALLERSDVYHAVEKMKSFEKGMDYEDIVTTYVIFICTFDYFKLGEDRYELQWRLLKHLELDIYPKTVTILLNAKARSKEKKLDALLHFLDTSEATDSYTEELVKAVKRVKESEENRRSYMTFDEIVKFEKKKEAERVAEEVSNQVTVDMCKKMLEENGDKTFISKVTGFSLEKIEDIEKEIRTKK